MTGTEQDADRAAFDKSMAKAEAKAEPAEKVEARREEAKRVLASPEKIWNEAAAHKARFAKPKEEPKAPEKSELAEEPLPPLTSVDDEKPEEGDEGEENPELERAKTALIRSGFKKKELASMSHKEILTRGLARARALEATDEAWNLAKGAKAQTPKAEGSATGTTQSAQLPDLKDALGPLAKELLLDERGAAALEDAFKKILTPIVQANASQPAAHGQQDQLTINVNASRKELEGVFPQLVDPVIWEQITPIMDTLAALPKYRQHKSAKEAIRAVMNDACEAYGLDRDDDGVMDRDDEHKARRHSRSTPTGRSRVTAGPAADPDRAAFDHLRAHPGDTRGARKAAGG